MTLCGILPQDSALAPTNTAANTAKIRQLAERYASPPPQFTCEIAALVADMDEPLKKMGIVRYKKQTNVHF